MTKLLTLIAAMLASTACNQQAPFATNNGQTAIPSITTLPAWSDPTVPADRPLPAPSPMAPATDRASPTPGPAPAPPVPESEKSAVAAKKVVEAYFAALAERRYDDAYRLFPVSGMSAVQFAASNARYKTYTAAVGTPGDSEGGAGSIYIEIPVVVTGTLRSDAPFRLEGPVALRRVNDVDGATAAQLRWHIFSTGLKR